MLMKSFASFDSVFCFVSPNSRYVFSVAMVFLHLKFWAMIVNFQTSFRNN
jgi:hypothetical protein